MKWAVPYLVILLAFFGLLLFKYPQVFQYKFDQKIVKDYFRSQDIEDPQGLIKDRVIMSDSDTYQATGYLYVTGSDPVKYNFQHPPLVKYLFGFSTLLTGNPYWVQIIFGLALLWLTYFLGTKVFKNKLVAMIPVLLLLIDPLFGSMMTETLLDLGQTVFALGFVILMLFYPESYILQGLVLGLFAASKFWSTAIIFVGLVYLYKILFKHEKVNIKQVFLSFAVAFITFSLVYIVSFVKTDGGFNMFFFLAKDLKYMLAHDSAGAFGGTMLMFLKTNIIWIFGIVGGIWGAIKTKPSNPRFFIFLLPIIYLLSISTQLPFARYFLIILPFLYLALVIFLGSFNRQK